MRHVKREELTYGRRLYHNREQKWYIISKEPESLYADSAVFRARREDGAYCRAASWSASLCDWRIEE